MTNSYTGAEDVLVCAPRASIHGARGERNLVHNTERLTGASKHCCTHARQLLLDQKSRSLTPVVMAMRSSLSPLRI